MNKRLLSRAAIPAALAVLVLGLGLPPAGAAAPAATRPTCRASMTNSHPRDFTSTGVRVRTAPYAHIKTVAHYRTVTHPKNRTANSHGRRTVWYYISGATPGYRVIVDVYVSRHGRANNCSTSFTPHQ
jgi:hypothetical protein